jgi:hypothetical protein
MSYLSWFVRVPLGLLIPAANHLASNIMFKHDPEDKNKKNKIQQSNTDTARYFTRVVLSLVDLGIAYTTTSNPTISWGAAIGGGVGLVDAHLCHWDHLDETAHMTVLLLSIGGLVYAGIKYV